ncbi:MAG: RNA-binding domain-containing protein [Candidatus Nanoarchaeia archaeon]|nr:hypothetical protein [Candidatus Haiyanarchaeum thermophilum]MCW1302803.1 hypothetical protein [Candidatus Haiyanarchaeum thermophilum]MCW1303484.1 hypothetical protein [Candidatus Haiyanarchaeum thermophilum]MCW1306664.1 hypothetical protein [Candidatus Haiyanarchaeum thermophilum]MCW1307380.1 hypothetical protein [Candidatus Haiyanarchaeum thermophilum]
MIKSIEARTYKHESEDLEKVMKAFLNVFPFEEAIKMETLEGSFGTEIIVISGIIKERIKVEKFIANLQQKLVNKLGKEGFSKRVERNSVFLRIDKQAAFLEDKIVIGNFDDCIWVKIKGDASGLKALRKILE